MTGPGAYREVSLLDLAEKFPTENAARDWFETIIWPKGERRCPRCGSVNTHAASHARMPYRCRDCRGYFSVKTGTFMEGSPLSPRKWVFAICLDAMRPKGISSVQLHRGIGVTQKTAWLMQRRIREAFANAVPQAFDGAGEVDETCIGAPE
ncbi:IS1595 family transposase [Candidatus Palauibacter soopunensis]|uniref:IS1595 family transposase n=1 Tax=Candidatus Palauibacter soopunensis TaxID=3056739 RepID=UPI002394EEE2|nr:IS1595 family transposase [Candidatus Palauibacter soopunensis]MDE2879672.1 IS1595 family transposase [Candidatus Palauibacter soopunensis]